MATTTKKDSEEPEDSTELDPRIQIELENLNTATDDINKLEIELEEANSTFRILMNESTRRLKLSSKKLGSCIEKARPYYEALEKAKVAQLECQAATLKYQRANEIHAAAKETVALAEQRFMSNSHEWQFDNAWQEMLNHATIKVMDAEKQKAESGAEHQKKAKVFEEAEKKVQQLEERYHRSIQKSRPYFDEKQLCQEQLEAQKGRIQQLEQQIQSAKTAYSTALRNLEKISEEIHQQRGDLSQAAPSGPREPGVGAELSNIMPAASSAATTATNNGGHHYHPHHNHHHHHHQQQQQQHHHHHAPYSNGSATMPDISSELDKCEIHSVGSVSVTTSSAVSEKDPNEMDDDSDEYPTLNVDGETATADDDLHLELLRQKVRTLAVRPVEGGDGQQQEQDVWEHELNATVDKLDHLMMMRECSRSSGSFGKSARNSSASPASPESSAAAAAAGAVAGFSSLPNTPKHHHQVGSGSLVSPATPPHEQQQQQAIKMFKKLDPLPLANVSMYALPTYLSQATGTGTGDDAVGAMIVSPGQRNTLLTPMASDGEAHYGAAIKPKRKMSM